MTVLLGRVNSNAGHGYAWPRPDGYRDRCGGPAICRKCQADVTLVRQMQTIAGMSDEEPDEAQPEETGEEQFPPEVVALAMETSGMISAYIADRMADMNKHGDIERFAREMLANATIIAGAIMRDRAERDVAAFARLLEPIDPIKAAGRPARDLDEARSADCEASAETTAPVVAEEPG